MKVEFVDELPEAINGRAAGRGKYADFADKLRENPGTWAVMPTNVNPNSIAQRICVGTLKGFEKGEFEAAVRNGKVYVRFRSIGERTS